MTAPTIIITGASRGLGAATAEILSKRGANVVLNARSVNDLKDAASRVEAAGARALIASGDVANADDCLAVVQAAVEQFGGLDALVNNAGLLQPIAPVADAQPQAWAANLAVNLLGPFYLIHYALPYLRQSRGRVINVSSGAATGVTRGWSAYAAAKAALNHFTRVLAVEEPDIVALSFRPGVVDTAMQQLIREKGGPSMSATDHQRFRELHKKGELLPPEAPGRALAALALAAAPEWSGEFIAWDDIRVQQLASFDD